MTVINTNLTSLTTQQSLKKSQSSVSTSMERLSSGLRVNSAKDDAAGLAIGNRMQAQKVGLGQAVRNTNDGISMSQTAQGVLSEVNDRLQRIRELTVQGLNSGTLGTRDSDAIQAEINQNLMEIDRLAQNSEYNGIPLMTGQAGRVDLQVGANDKQTLGLDLSPPGFTVDALGLTDFNVAGEPGSVTPRDTLYGPADDIVLEDFRTTVNYPEGAERTLYALGDDVSLAGDHQQAGAAIDSYYISMGGGNFSQVNVSATHETATDLSVVDITAPSPLYRDSFSLGNTQISSGLQNNEQLVKAGDIYYIEKNENGRLSYQEANFEIASGSSISRDATVKGVGDDPLLGNYSEITSEFDFQGATYNLEDFENGTVAFFDVSNSKIPNGEAILVKDGGDNPYLEVTSGNDVSYYRLGNVSVKENLQVLVGNSYPPVDGEDFQEVDSLVFNSENYDVTNYNNVIYAELINDDEIVGAEIVKSNISPNNYYIKDVDGNYFEISDVNETSDIELTAEGQAYAGLDVESQGALPSYFIQNIDETPMVNFAGATPTFENYDGNEFATPSNFSLVQSATSQGGWVIKEALDDGAYGYYNATIDVELDSEGKATAYTAKATQPSPTILGVDEHIVEKVWGTSTVTIDPRNVSVEYTDIEGRTYSNVLTEGDDGNYYFELPGESSLRGGYKTATLVDHDQKGEIILRTENGYSEVVVFYPTELEKGVNRAFYVQTDGDGFGDDGTPHTRLRIQEVGEDFRIQMPRNPLAALDKAIGMVDSKRSYLGALDNRLEAVINTNETATVNVAEAQSRIMDADYAQESADMVRAQILQQAGNSVLGQANVMPETVLALLG